MDDLFPFCRFRHRILRSNNLTWRLPFPRVSNNGCKTWSLTFREEHRLRGFKNRVLKRISGSKRDEMVAGWRKVRTSEVRLLQIQSDQVQEYEMGRACVRIGRRGMHMCRILVGKSEGKIQLGRPKCRWEDNIKMGLREINWSNIEWIHVAQGRDSVFVNTVMNLRVPKNVEKILSS
jgi:hypothetical protein